MKYKSLFVIITLGDTMEAIILGLLIFIFLATFLLWYILTYNHFQEYLIQINEAESQIDSILRKRFDLLNKSINIIKAHTEIEEEILPEIVKLRSRKLSNFELDRKLYDCINEFELYKEKYETLKTVDSFYKIDQDLNDSEIEIIAARKYYNDTITKFNRLAQTFPSVIIAKLYKLHHRDFYDEKNTTDEHNCKL